MKHKLSEEGLNLSTEQLCCDCGSCRNNWTNSEQFAEAQAPPVQLGIRNSNQHLVNTGWSGALPALRLPRAFRIVKI